MADESGWRREVERLRDAVAKIREEVAGLPRSWLTGRGERVRAAGQTVEEKASAGLEKVQQRAHRLVVRSGIATAFGLLVLLGLLFLVAALYLACAAAWGPPVGALVAGLATLAVGVGGLRLLGGS